MNSRLSRGGLTAVILILAASTACAVSIGISPGTLDFPDVLKGGYAENVLTVSTSSDKPLNVSVTVNGPIKDWIKVNETSFTIEPDAKRHDFKFTVQPPAGTPNGMYKGGIVAAAMPLGGAVGGGMGSVVVTAVESQVTVHVTGTQTVKYDVQQVTVKDTEEGQPIEFDLRVNNKGNVRITPQVHVEIFASTGESVKTLDYSQTEILPTTTEDIVIKAPNDLGLGDYKAKVKVSVDSEKAQYDLDFKVLERGSLRMQGQLLTVNTNKVWSQAGEPVQLTAVFKNSGVLVAPAKLKGKVMLGEEIVDVVESDEINVPAGEESELTIFYTPKRSGQYKVVCWVYYSKKVTPEMFVVLNVQPNPNEGAAQPAAEPAKAASNTALYLVIGALGLVIIVMAAVLLRRGGK